MNRIIISRKNNDIVCIKRINGEVTYITDPEEFNLILRSVSKNSQIKIKDKDMAININGGSIILRDFESLLSMEPFELLALRIKQSIERNGFIDLTNRDMIEKRGKNNKYHNAVITKVLLLIIAGLVSVNLFISALTQKKVSELDIQLPQTHLTDTLEFSGEDIDNATVDLLNIQNDTIANDDIESSIDLVSEIPNEVATLSFEELSQTDKAISAENNYAHLIKKYSSEMGLDPDLMLGIATQERGKHSSEIDPGGGIGLMQVQHSVWSNVTINYYKLNPETNTFEMHSEKITDEKLENLETNIEIGCMIFQNCLINSKYNIPMAIQMYNMGYGAIYDIIDSYAYDKGITRGEVVNNPLDLGWLEYRYLKNGDPMYLENVNKWVDKNVFEVINVLDGTPVSIEFVNPNEKII